MNKSCYTCMVRKENCGISKELSPIEWLDHVCVMWFPRNDMLKMVLDKTTIKEKEKQNDRD
jgi:hypothetical protein